MRDDIDKILKDKLINGDPEVGSFGWEQLEVELIAADREKNRRDRALIILRFSRYAALGLLIVGLGYLTNLYNSGIGNKTVATGTAGPKLEMVEDKPTAMAEISNQVGMVDEKPTAVAETPGPKGEMGDDIFTAEKEETNVKLAVGGSVSGEASEVSVVSADNYFNESVSISGKTDNGDLTFHPGQGSFRLGNPAVPTLYVKEGLEPITAKFDRLEIDQYLQEFSLLYGEEERTDNKWWISTTTDVLSANSGFFGAYISPDDNIFEKVGSLVSNISINGYYDDEFYEYLGDKPHEILCSGGGGLGVYDHALPISIGFTINREIYKKFGIGTGLAYKKMWSNAGAIRGSHYEQTIEYLGVQINVNYDLLPVNSNWDLNLVLGINADKAVFVEGKDCLSYQGVITEYPSNLENPKEIMYLSYAGVGVGYRLFKGVSIYSESSFRYSLYTKGQPITFFTDRLFGVVIRAGLKFDF